MTELQLQSLVDLVSALGVCIMFGVGYISAVMP